MNLLETIAQIKAEAEAASKNEDYIRLSRLGRKVPVLCEALIDAYNDLEAWKGWYDSFPKDLTFPVTIAMDFLKCKQRTNATLTRIAEIMEKK